MVALTVFVSAGENSVERVVVEGCAEARDKVDGYLTDGVSDAVVGDVRTIRGGCMESKLVTSRKGRFI